MKIRGTVAYFEVVVFEGAHIIWACRHDAGHDQCQCSAD